MDEKIVKEMDEEKYRNSKEDMFKGETELDLVAQVMENIDLFKCFE